ncbi:MAG: DUF1919 domain-containing protein [Clostridia bacterium]|nr:DUF1919 domain-containing protein [Clostridia bacterium]
MTGKYIRRKIKKLKKWITERPYYIRRYFDRKLIRRRDFTIISNNCWAGRCYQYLDMPYLSPTVGLYFFAEDYLRFVSDLRYYLSLELEFISWEQSKYRETLRERRHTEVPIAMIGDVEIVFLHYKTEAEAREKWERRKKRVNYDDVILKFSKMNLCTEEHLKKFDALQYKNKFMINNSPKKKYGCEVYWAEKTGTEELSADTNPFPGKIPFTVLLNKKAENYPKTGLINNQECI